MVKYPPVTDARRRIEAAFSPELIGRLAHRLADGLGAHFEHVAHSRGKVLNWIAPAENVAPAAACLNADPLDAAAKDPSFVADVTERFRALVETILARGNNLHDPRYIGHQVPASSPIAALFDAVGSATNQVMAIYEMGPCSDSRGAGSPV